MINCQNPSLRQKQFSESVRRSISLFLFSNPISILGEVLHCSRVIASKDLKAIDVFLTSATFKLEDVSEILDKKLRVEKEITNAIKKNLANELSLRYIPEISFYIEAI